jgi:polycomb protein EED
MTVGLTLSGGAKESHNRELYSVAWSSDTHVGYYYDDRACNDLVDTSFTARMKTTTPTYQYGGGNTATEKNIRPNSASIKKDLTDQNVVGLDDSPPYPDEKNGVQDVMKINHIIVIDGSDSSSSEEEEAGRNAVPDSHSMHDGKEMDKHNNARASADKKLPNVDKNRRSGYFTKKGDAKNTTHESKNRKPFYCQYMATCGGNHLTLYQVKVSGIGPESKIKARSAPSGSVNHGNFSANSNVKERNTHGSGPDAHMHDQDSDFQVRQVYRDVDKEELFYACIFAGRSTSKFDRQDRDVDVEHNNYPQETVIDSVTPMDDNNKKDHQNEQKQRQPQLCCVGGKHGNIKIIDTVKQSLIASLVGHTDEIYDLKRCPTNEWLILSASNDETIRLWNLKCPTCICIFAGHDGHREAVLSIDWHPMGGYFVSSGMDQTIKLWSCEDDKIKAAIQSSFTPPDLSHFCGSESGRGIGGGSFKRKRMMPATSRDRTYFPTVYHQLPFFSTSKIHTDYIDCVAFVGDLILSKSTTNNISLWKPILSSISTGTNHKFLHLQDYSVPECGQWFIRFATDKQCKMLAVGNCIGDLRVWEIGGAKKPIFICNTMCNSIVRMVRFSPDAKVLAAVCDDGSVWKYNVVP